MREQWERLNDTAERLKVPGGWLYKTWRWNKGKREGFFSVQEWCLKADIQTVFVPGGSEPK